MEAKAVAKFIRVSPQKTRMVAKVVKGKPVEAGLSMLKFMPQKPAEVLARLIRSALANAEQRGDVDVDTLMIRDIMVNQGPSLKRFRPMPQGRAGRILKRMSHITVVLE